MASTLRSLEAHNSSFDFYQERLSRGHVANRRHSFRENLPPSPAGSAQYSSVMARNYAASEDEPQLSPHTFEQKNIWTEIERGAPGDASIFDDQTPAQREIDRQRGRYYAEVFEAHEPLSKARNLVSEDSLVHAEFRTNLVLQDEHKVINELSQCLAERYYRPLSCIVITITHSATMLFGGSFEPAYILSITALTTYVQAATNRVNAYIIQNNLMDILGVEPRRGMVKFIAVPEENYAYHGSTVYGMIQDLQKGTKNDRTLARNRTQAVSKKRQSLRNLRDLVTRSSSKSKDKEAIAEGRPTTCYSEVEYSRPSTGRSNDHNMTGPHVTSYQDCGRRPSSPFIERHFAETTRSTSPQPPPILRTKSAMAVKASKAQMVTKRKSFINIILRR